MPRGKLLNPTDPEERFWSKVDRSGGTNTCWIYLGAKNRGGYGSFWYLGMMQIASRVAFHFSYGLELPSTLQVLHHCDNPPCCNPIHLFLGSNTDNKLDSVMKRRNRGGSGPRLSDDLVLLIRRKSALGLSDANIARELNLNRRLICSVRRREFYKYVISSDLDGDLTLSS